ncbi:MAG: endonuclease/exonuclease/phosphatase family protein [Pirellulaceae bacterium]|nr:endonuclease/exonuclease/phosphatase family protein [Pirellulaceae bacterium]
MPRLTTNVFRAVLLSLFVALTGAGLPASAVEYLKVMTFNVRYDTQLTGTDQAQSWNYYLNDDNDRRDRAVAIVEDFAPDILGVQELEYYQLQYLNEELTGYGYYGVGRKTGGTGLDAGERSGIFYRTDRFTAVGQGEFWLSDTPQTPGTTFSTISNIPRMVTWLKLLDQQTGDTYLVMNSHWAHLPQDTESRLKSGQLMREKLDELSGGLPAIAMGDLNETRADAGYLALLDADPGEVELTDSYDQTGLPQGKTFHDWLGGMDGERIDHIFHSSADFQAVDAEIVRTTFGGFYPSDHYPVAATLRAVPEPPCGALLSAGAFIGSGAYVWRKGLFRNCPRRSARCVDRIIRPRRAARNTIR